MQEHDSTLCLSCSAPFHARPSRRQKYCSHACYVQDTTSNPVVRFWLSVNKRGPDDCWLWTGATRGNGYGTFTVNRRSVGTHCFSYQLAYGAYSRQLCVCHNCPNGDNPLCVNPRHLFLGTRRDNMLDMWAKGRGPTGERHGMRRHPERRAGEQCSYARLTAVQVIAIRARYQPGGAAACELATEFGISRATVHDIVARRRWKHLAPAVADKIAASG